MHGQYVTEPQPESTDQPTTLQPQQQQSNPTYSNLRANPSPEVTDQFCRLPLPTLFYATRGCSPWRPAADMGTAWLEIQISPPDFQGPTAGHRTRQELPCFTFTWTLSPGNLIPGVCVTYKEKKTLPGPSVDVSGFGCVAAIVIVEAPRTYLSHDLRARFRNINPDSLSEYYMKYQASKTSTPVRHSFERP